MARASLIFLILSGIPIHSFAFELGISSSGNDVTVDFWFQSEASSWGMYSRAMLDFESYENGTQVAVCRSGSISGSTGSGTCSGHGGVSHTKEAEFDRIAFSVGPTYWVSKKIQIHGGLFWGLYSSDVNIGDDSAHNFSETGLDFGVSVKPFSQSEFKLIISRETDQKRTLFGFRFKI